MANEPKQAGGLGVKRMDDAELVKAIRGRIVELCVLINEADRRDIEVNFDIRKPPGKLKGGYRVNQCELRRKL